MGAWARWPDKKRVEGRGASPEDALLELRRVRVDLAMRAALLSIVLGLTACATLLAPSRRTLEQLDIKFSASQPTADSISAEQAIEAVRDVGVEIAREPDNVEFGLAHCLRVTLCFQGGLSSVSQVWLIEWLPSTGPESAKFIVDSTSGEVLSGAGGP